MSLSSSIIESRLQARSVKPIGAGVWPPEGFRKKKTIASVYLQVDNGAVGRCGHPPTAANLSFCVSGDPHPVPMLPTHDLWPVSSPGRGPIRPRLPVNRSLAGRPRRPERNRRFKISELPVSAGDSDGRDSRCWQPAPQPGCTLPSSAERAATRARDRRGLAAQGRFWGPNCRPAA
jgi:hypothetical protein